MRKTWRRDLREIRSRSTKYGWIYESLFAPSKRVLAGDSVRMTGGIRPYAPRQAQYDTWSEGIPRAYMGQVPGHTWAM
jgi:hypothetical protein